MKPGMNTVLMTWHILWGGSCLSLHTACPLNWSFWLQHSHRCWKWCRFTQSCWRHDGDRKQSLLWLKPDLAPRITWRMSLKRGAGFLSFFSDNLHSTCSLFCPSYFYEVIAKQIITAVIIFCWGLTVSDMCRASLTSLEVGTIIIPTSMMSKTKQPLSV